jgi:hypothetical protein
MQRRLQQGKTKTMQATEENKLVMLGDERVDGGGSKAATQQM